MDSIHLEMQLSQQHSRINLAELKAQLVTKIGPERCKQYFYYLARLLSLKLSKVELDKIFVKVIGRENIPLHNHFIRSILKNACCAKVPPPKYDYQNTKPKRIVANSEPSSYGSPTAISQAASLSALSSGDILPLSRRKARKGAHEHRGGDRQSVLGPTGKTNFALQQSTTWSGEFNTIFEHGDSTPSEIPNMVQHHEGLMQQAENGEAVLGLPTQETMKSPDGLVPVRGKDWTELLVREDGKELSSWSLLCAPLGIPFCRASIGGACGGLPLASGSKCASLLNSGGLLEIAILGERMEQIATTQGLEGVSLECANVLNNGLDAYLKGLIGSCIELMRARSGDEPLNNSIPKNHGHMKIINVIGPGFHYQMQCSSRPLEAMRLYRPRCSISLLDFRVAVELNLQQLGEDWPLLLEKICTDAFDE